jgi:hypothetical protein
MAASTVCGFALAAMLFSSQISAQSAATSHGKNGLFATLKIGQMVEFKTDGWGVVIATYDDEEYKNLMLHKVKEIGADYIVVEFDDKNGTGTIAEHRLPVYRFSQVVHLGKADARKKAAAAPGSLNDAPGGTTDKKAAPDKKPGSTKKKP